MYGGQSREIPRLSDTRWACRYAACHNLLDRLPAVVRVLQEIGLERNGDRAVDARGLLGQIDLNFIGLLVTFSKVLGQSKFLSDMLQSPSLDLAAAVSLVDALLDTLQHYRTDAFFNVVWTEIEKIAVNCDVTMEKADKRQSMRNTRLSGYLVTAPTGERRIDCDKESFQKHVFYPVLDSMMGELKRRFSKPNCKIMKGIQALHPQSSTFLHEDLFAFAEIFDSNVDDLTHEIHQIKRVLERRESSGRRG